MTCNMQGDTKEDFFINHLSKILVIQKQICVILPVALVVMEFPFQGWR